MEFIRCREDGKPNKCLRFAQAYNILPVIIISATNIKSRSLFASYAKLCLLKTKEKNVADLSKIWLAIFITLFHNNQDYHLGISRQIQDEIEQVLACSARHMNGI